MEETKIRMYAKGEVVSHGTSLDLAIKMLSAFNKTYTYCIDKYAKRYGRGEQFIFEPQLNIEYLRKGSLTSLFTVDFPAAYAMVKPLIVDNAWDLLKYTVEFSQAYIGTIKRTREIPTVHIQNSPDSTNLVFINHGNGNFIVGKDILDAFKCSAKDISTLAESVVPNQIQFLDIKRESSNNKVLDKLRIDIKNGPDLVVKEEEIFDPEERAYPCKIYSFNVRSRKGRLDIVKDNSFSGDEFGSVHFEVEDGRIDGYVDALKEECVIITAKSKVIVNTIGERRISYLYPVQISL